MVQSRGPMTGNHMPNSRTPAPRKGEAPATSGGARRDAELTKEDILIEATREFAEKGLSGARIDEIAKKTRTSKRMIYYYFHSKEELYRSVLAREYGRIRETEQQQLQEGMAAHDALARLIRVTFDWHMKHPEFVRLVMNENIHRAEHLEYVDGIRERNESVIRSLLEIIKRGEDEGTFRSGLDPIDLHMNISALCFYSVSNRHTFNRVFGRDMGRPKVASARREQIVEIILSWCRKE